MPPLRGRRGSLATTLLPLVLVGAAALFGFLWWQEQQKSSSLSQQLTAAQQQLADKDAQYDQAMQQVAALKGDNKTLKDNLSSLRDQLASAQRQTEDLGLKLKAFDQEKAELTEEKTKLMARATSAAKERDELAQKVKTLDQDNTTLQRSVSRLRERLAWLDRDYRQVAEQLAKLQAERANAVNESVSSYSSPDLSSAPTTAQLPDPAAASTVRPSASASSGMVELPPIIVRKEQPAGMSAPVRGRVIDINTVHHFLVVDKGSQDGVQVGTVFNIVRGATPVGRTTVVRVRPQLSACDLPEATANQVHVGDLVVDAGWSSS